MGDPKARIDRLERFVQAFGSERMQGKKNDKNRL
jgi:hypothetical protein